MYRLHYYAIPIVKSSELHMIAVELSLHDFHILSER